MTAIVQLGDLNQAIVRRDELAAKVVAGGADAADRDELATLDRAVHAAMEFAQRRRIESLLDLGASHGAVLENSAFPGDSVIVRTYDKVVLEGETMDLGAATARLCRKHNRNAKRADWAPAGGG